MSKDLNKIFFSPEIASSLGLEEAIILSLIESNSSKIKVQFVGKFSSMIEMMIKKPLSTFIDSLKNKIENISF